MLRLSKTTFNPVESLATNGYTSFPAFVAVILALSLILVVLRLKFKCETALDIFMFTSVLFCGFVTVALRQEVYTCLAVTGLVLLAFSYAAQSLEISDIKLDRRTMLILIAVPSVLLALYIGVTAVYRYLTFNVPNYDGGIFFQMFYYMKNHLTMQTTLERDTLISHMKVHVSPAFWLMFPIYFIFPYQQTIQFCQGIVLAIAVVPLGFLCRKKGVSRFKTAVICAIYCFMPYVAGGCGYDVHENMFLPVAIFCLLYAFECKSWVGLIFSLAFLLSVKEDAAIYSCFIGLYMLLSKGTKDKNHIKSLIVMALSVVYFVIAVSYVQNSGYSSATDRFNNMIYGGDGNILGMIPTIIINPGYAIKEIMNSDNIKYIVAVLAPMLFIPLKCKNYRLYILAMPFLLFNLMPDYAYFHDIGFQYTFGSGTLLFYMMVENITADSEHNSLKTLCMCLIAAVLFFTSGLIGRLDYVKMYYSENYRQIYDEMEEALEQIPDNAEVTAGTYICSRLAQRDIIYEDYYTDKVTEYRVLDLRGTDYDYDISLFYESMGYETLAYKEGVIAVFRRK
jgi:uncharacterized membrane protein